MKTWIWIVLLIVVALIAFALGRYWSGIATAYKNRDKISAGLGIAENLGTLLG